MRRSKEDVYVGNSQNVRGKIISDKEENRMKYIPSKYNKIIGILITIFVVLQVFIGLFPNIVNHYQSSMQIKAIDNITSSIEEYYLALDLDNISQTCYTDEQIELVNKISRDLEAFGNKYQDEYGQHMFKLFSGSYSDIEYIIDNSEEWNMISEDRKIKIINRIGMLQSANKLSEKFK